MIKLIASDMDGTLLDASHSISFENKQAILTAQQQDIEFIVATGRAYKEAIMPLKENDIRCAAICLNGAMIYDEQGQMLKMAAFTTKQLNNLFNIFQQEDVFFQVYTDKRIYTINIEQDVDNYCRMIANNGHQPNIEKIKKRIYERVAQGDLQELNDYEELRNRTDETILKLLCMIDNRQHYQHIINRLNQEVENIAVSSSGHGNIEITHQDAQKGLALQYYSKFKNVSLKNTMAIGDNLNDLSMLHIAGISYAMDNGPKIVKDSAKFIVPSNIKNGVAVAIRQILKENK